MKHLWIRLATSAAVLIAGGFLTVQAASLIPDKDGLTVYDTVNNITWLADTNLAATNRFGLPLCNGSEPVTRICVNASGSMHYEAAAAWVAAMNAANYLGHNNWQLPTSPETDATCGKVGPHGGSFGFGCTASAMGSLYVTLGLKPPNTAVPVSNNTAGPFSNLQPYLYWSQSAPSPTQGNSTFSFATGWVGSNTLPNFLFILPMLPGKIAGTPAATGTGLQVNPDGQTVYDPVTDITWVRNGNLAATNTFGLPACTDPTTPATCVASSGAMAYASATQFITNMNTYNGTGYLGQTHWQLPVIDVSCKNYNCSGAPNPMGNLFYGQLGLSQGTPVAIPNLAVGPFRNMQPYLYWSCQAATIRDVCSADQPAPNFQWSYSFGSGFQGTDLQANTLYTTAYYVDQPPSSFTVGNRGGISLTSSGTGTAISTGYGTIQPNAGSATPSGVAIFGFRQNNILLSEVGVPATPVVSSGRIYAEIAGSVDAGIAIANPNGSAASINFYFTDTGGNAAGSGSTTIAANQQVAQFLDQAPFKVYSGASFQGTFTFTSSLPVAVVALRGFTNESGNFLMSTLPVIDPTAAPSTGSLVVPHFADGSGWTTQLLLVNPGETPMTGTVQFTNPSGAAANVTIAGQTNSSFAYSVARRTSTKMLTSGLPAQTASGSIIITPASGGAAPTPVVLFSYKPGATTVSEASVPVAGGSAFRFYVEASGVPGKTGSIQSGIAAANNSTAPATVTIDVTDLAGAPVSGAAPFVTTLPGSGQTARFLSDLFPSLPAPFKGVLRIAATGSGISVVGLRTHMNERGDFLITTTPPSNENSTPQTGRVYFPQIADGGGYTTQFILFSGTAGQTASGTLTLTRQDGTALDGGVR